MLTSRVPLRVTTPPEFSVKVVKGSITPVDAMFKVPFTVIAVVPVLVMAPDTVVVPELIVSVPELAMLPAKVFVPVAVFVPLMLPLVKVAPVNSTLLKVPNVPVVVPETVPPLMVEESA